MPPLYLYRGFILYKGFYHNDGNQSSELYSLQYERRRNDDARARQSEYADENRAQCVKRKNYYIECGKPRNERAARERVYEKTRDKRHFKPHYPHRDRDERNGGDDTKYDFGSFVHTVLYAADITP